MGAFKSKTGALAVALLATVALAACSDDDGQTPQADSGVADSSAIDGAAGDGSAADGSRATRFAVRIENVGAAKRFVAAGMANTAVGASAPGPLTPGDAYEISFSAPVGARISFATMFVQSNDLFYAPDPAGIALYDAQGAPRSGDVTAEVKLWDAGTEVDQEPGVGADQAPRQSGPNTGAADSNTNVRLAADTFNNLPAVSAVIRAELSSLGEGKFTLRLSNVSTATTLMTSTSQASAVPLAPAAWVVHNDDGALFESGKPAPAGLEALAEDGAAMTLAAALGADAGVTPVLAPGVWAVHSEAAALFEDGKADRGEGLEALAEDGSPAALATAAAARSGVSSAGAFDTPEGDGAPGPATPGKAYTFTIMARPGEALSLATMYVQSNDLFYAPAESGISLFDGQGQPTSGDQTMTLSLWDAGTEKNQEPGIGADQAPRQSGPNSGEAENGLVREVNDGFTYPQTSTVIKLTITPQPAS